MTRQLQKGENISLANENELIVGMKWIKKANNSQTENENINSGALMLGSDNKISQKSDFIFHTQSISTNNAIIFKNQLFKVTLSKIPESIIKVPFIVAFNQPLEKQDFSLFKVIIKIFDFHNKQELLSFSLEDATTETALIMGSLYKHQQQWKFRAVGQGYINGLESLIKNFVNIKIKQSYEDESIIDVTGQTQKIIPIQDNIRQDINQSRKIKLKYEKIEHAIQKHSKTMDLLNGYFQDDDNVEEIEIINNEATSNLTTIQIELLEIFVENNYTVLQTEIEKFAKLQKLLKNQLINSINEICYEQLDDILIEEDETFYVMNEIYCQRVFENVK